MYLSEIISVSSPLTGLVHLWSDSEQPTLNPYSQPSVLPNEVTTTLLGRKAASSFFHPQEVHPLPYISYDDADPKSAPLSAVPMPASK